MHSFNWSMIFIKLQGVTANQSFQESSPKWLFKKMISTISRLQDKSSEVVESNIQGNSTGLYSSNTTAIYDSLYFSTICSQSAESNPTIARKWSIIFTGDNNTQKMVTYHETQFIFAIADLIISEGLSFNLSQKPRFKKVLELARTVSKFYQPPNRKLISKDLLDVIHNHKMERNFSLIKKESDILELLFKEDGATISRIPLLNILVSGRIFQ